VRAIVCSLTLMFMAMSANACVGLTDVDDLPLVEMAPRRAGQMLAVFVSGDGGWRAIDQRVAEQLHARGFGIVGLVSPRFFAKARTAEESSCALQRIMEHYVIRWRAPRVVVIGYSRGAGVLPFMVNRLSAPWRNRIVVVALMGLDPTVAFHVTPFPEPEFPVRGEVERLRSKHVLCFYGVNERDSLCRQISPAIAMPIAEPGSHHFAGNYDDLARTIWRWSRS
jgi:type IV secretory pathway VirJ component